MIIMKIKCPHCKKEYYSSGIKSHIIWCKKNPDKNQANKIRKNFQGENNPFYGKIGYWHNKKNPEHSKRMTGKKFSEESKQKMRDNHADVSGENNPMFGKKHPQETIKLQSNKRKEFLKNHPGFIKETLKNRNQWKEKNPNWNLDRASVYAPYGENFHNKILRQARWQLQSGRCLLSGK